MNVTRVASALFFFAVAFTLSNAEAQMVCGAPATTPIQGILQGEADVIRSQGLYNKLTAEAANISQETYNKALDNEIKRVDYYYKRKDIHDYNVERQRKPRLSSETLSRINMERAPQRLTRQHIDSQGTIYWPATLEANAFAVARTELEILFEERANGSAGLGTENYRQIQQVARRLKAALQDQVTRLDSSEYMQAKKFIDSLSFEARFPAPQAAALAAD